MIIKISDTLIANNEKILYLSLYLFVLTFSPFALFIARKGLSTRNTRKTFTNDIGPALKFCVLHFKIVCIVRNISNH